MYLYTQNQRSMFRSMFIGCGSPDVPLRRHVKCAHPFRQRPHVVPMPSFFVRGASEQPHDFLGRRVVQGPTAHHGTRLTTDEPKGGNGRPSVLVGHQFEPRPVVPVVDKDGFGLAGKHSIDFDGQLHRPTRTPAQCARVVRILEPSKRVQGVRLLDDGIVASKEIQRVRVSGDSPFQMEGGFVQVVVRLFQPSFGYGRHLGRARVSRGYLQLHLHPDMSGARFRQRVRPFGTSRHHGEFGSHRQVHGFFKLFLLVGAHDDLIVCVCLPGVVSFYRLWPSRARLALRGPMTHGITRSRVARCPYKVR